jgi:hypothetical protein
MVFRLKKRAASVILDAPYIGLSSTINRGAFAYKRIKGAIAPYLFETLKLNRKQHIQEILDTPKSILSAQSTKGKLVGGKTFTVTTIKLWNSLPLNLRRQLNVRLLKSKYVDNLYEQQQSLCHF